jgi:hypothetical protein
METFWTDLLSALIGLLPFLLPLLGQEGFDLGMGEVGGGVSPGAFTLPDFSPYSALGADASKYLVNLPDPMGPGPGAPPTPSFGGAMENLSYYAKQAAPILGGLTMGAQIPLQIAGLSEATRGRKALERGVQTQERAAAPQIAAEEALLPAATEALLTGKVPDAVEADIQNKVNAWEQTQLQNLSAQGIDANTARAMLAQQRTQMEQTLRMQWAQTTAQTGEGAAGGAVTAAGGAASFGSEEYQTAGQALANANQSMYRLLGATG